MSEAKVVKETDYLLAWFLFWLSSMIAGAIAGFIAGAIAGGILGLIGFDDPRVHMTGGAIAGFLVSIPISYGLFRAIVASIIVKRIETRAGAVATTGAG